MLQRWFLLCLAVSACTPENASNKRSFAGTVFDPNAVPAAGADGTASAAKDPNPTLALLIPVSYASDLEPAVSKLCTASCHYGGNSPGSVVLNTYLALKPACGMAVGAIDAGKMPSNAANLSGEDKKLLLRLSNWLKAWAKDDVYATDLAQLKINFKEHIEPISKGLCLSCHQASSAMGGLDLSTKEQWQAAMARVQSAIASGSMPPRVDAYQQTRLLNVLKEWETQAFP